MRTSVNVCMVCRIYFLCESLLCFSLKECGEILKKPTLPRFRSLVFVLTVSLPDSRLGSNVELNKIWDAQPPCPTSHLNVAPEHPATKLLHNLKMPPHAVPFGNPRQRVIPRWSSVGREKRNSNLRVARRPILSCSTSHSSDVLKVPSLSFCSRPKRCNDIFWQFLSKIKIEVSGVSICVWRRLPSKTQIMRAGKVMYLQVNCRVMQ